MHLRYLSRADVESLGLAMRDVIKIIEDTLFDKGEGRVEMPPTPAINPRPDAYLHAMPAYLKERDAAGIKWVSGYPANQEKGLPYVMGLVILNDPDTGAPLTVMDGTWLTAMRTAAATAVSAKYLARRDSSSLALLGCGVEARAHVESLTQVLPNLSRVQAFDTHPEALQAFETWVHQFDDHLDFRSTDHPRDAVMGADLVVTAGPIYRNPSPLIQNDWLARGALAAPLDFDSYWTPSAMKGVDKFYTDDKDQMMYYRQQGFFWDLPQIVGELGQVVSGQIPGRQEEIERIMVMNLGLGIEDIAIAHALYQRAVAQNVGTELPL